MRTLKLSFVAIRMLLIGVSILSPCWVSGFSVEDAPIVVDTSAGEDYRG